ncbi:MAG: hypothetical protein UR25_C0003G0021 [Candidatus Nomurabacteria bacterium GW2011_GWE1_32_28]|uniref:Uncharacterized protein n=1 Tax=Candidatus Nomurabacteria bacterium GW2011_GWF1_31_48 TaxID=1618767 RepID=A0A0F9YFS4_9BACT|nr:MAG: hypothetical protein UR10_C0003G0021 [Candidatus Nomurabacteria bacterium GW2011_GWF2_30_133]KKP28661.1 MAG: hypothetical protein UR18_C0002G0073 [Candidatus Nomurabacteria bacterium GW2011_GWE2_31_40]KKP30238.1 MAG: hypothetical protein UR19_C0003G0074 [Candidatus Nomurabacteria bacterium GW2011_GWF1_31_48]KKP34765.1 MAG: hypothetical protein UR25_C0003G0021 [Candidatus Nomurabacteria bacterium GW2011_GWE1_32_28]HAS80777.1 hypothetical protein [Candidatus Nomurabacteria bacterium]
MNYKRQIKKSKNTGYTIIETMIAISLFLIIITIGMGALLNANALHKKSQNKRSIVDNLNFIMEDMSRNIRTGSNYSCDRGPNCSSGGTTLSFISSDSTAWSYRISGNAIFRSISGVDTELTPSEVKINNSGFVVVGAEPFSTPDTQQPLVTIMLSGAITESDGSLTPFSLQTSVSQRLLDIN